MACGPVGVLDGLARRRSLRRTSQMAEQIEAGTRGAGAAALCALRGGRDINPALRGGRDINLGRLRRHHMRRGRGRRRGRFAPDGELLHRCELDAFGKHPRHFVVRAREGGTLQPPDRWPEALRASPAAQQHHVRLVAPQLAPVLALGAFSGSPDRRTEHGRDLECVQVLL